MPRPPVTIRPLAAADEPVWRTLWTGYLDYYETRVSEEVYATTFARLMGDAPYDPVGLVAEAEGDVVGLVHYLMHRHTWKIENICYLQDLYTAPEARGRGVGRALIEAVYAAADAAGTPSVYWTTQEFNYAGRMLYDKIGVKTPFIKYARP